MLRLRRAAPVLVLLPLLAVMCATSTEIDVDVYSEVTCDKNAEVGLILGDSLAQVATNAVSSTADNCDSSQRVGRLVISPSGDKDGPIAFAVVTRNDGQGLDTCTAANNYSGCIVAKRQLHFEEHTHLDVRVDLRLSCLDQPCSVTETCVRGACVSATCPSGGCADESVLASGSFDGGTTPAADAGVDSAVASTCHPTTPTALVSRVVVPNAGSVASSIATGLAQHRHLVYAQNDQHYWYFWSDNTGAQINTRTSCDLVNWVDGPPIPISGKPGPNAANFDVAYASLGGSDVFHLALDQQLATSGYSYDVRFRLVNGQPTTPSMTILQDPPDASVAEFSDCFDTDGPSALIGADGYVYIAAGYEVHPHDGNPRQDTECDFDLYKSDQMETGDDTQWAKRFTIKGYHNTQQFTTNHVLVPSPSGKVFGLFNEPEDGIGLYQSVAWLTQVDNWNGTDNGPYEYEYAAGSVFDKLKGDHGSNDWSVCLTADNKAYALRHINDSGIFEAEQWNGTDWIPDGAPNANGPLIPASTSTTMNTIGAGIVITTDGNANDGMIAFTIDATTNDLLSSSYDPSAGWKDWVAVPNMPSGVTRRWITGTGCSGSQPPIIMWTDLTNPTAAAIDMLDVSPLFPVKGH